MDKHLCWLSRLMYRAVSQGTIRFNLFEEAKYEAVECKPRFLSKGDVAKLLAFPLQDEGAELSRRMFLFSIFTGLAFADLQSLRASQIEMNSEGETVYPQGKTENGSGEFDTPASDSGADTFALHKGE